jgi:acetolactate synthase-1/2/3 large subunit
MGDAAFGMVGMDFKTAVRARIPVLALVVNNRQMGGHPRVKPVATERFGASSLSSDYTGVARALGGYAERVEAPADVLPALERGRKAVMAGRPALLEFITRP